MRTYDKLESYHYKEIKAAGFKKGATVWFCDTFLDEIEQGKIKSFDIHFEGQILFDIKVKGRLTSTSIPMYRVAKSEQGVKDLMVQIYERQIYAEKRSIKYLRKLIKNLKN